MLQLLEGVDAKLCVDVPVVEAQGAVLDLQLLHDLPRAQPGGVAIKDAALGLGQSGQAVHEMLKIQALGIVFAGISQPGKVVLHLLALLLQLVHALPEGPAFLFDLPQGGRKDAPVEGDAADGHKEGQQQTDQDHLQAAGEYPALVIALGDAHRQLTGVVFVQCTALADAHIGAVRAGELVQAAAHGAQH